MVFPERLSMRDCEQSDAHLYQIQQSSVSHKRWRVYKLIQDRKAVNGLVYLPAMAIDVVLHIHTYSTGALIQNSKLRLVIEQPSHLQQNKLLLAEGIVHLCSGQLQMPCKGMLLLYWGIRLLTAILCFSPPLRTSIQSWTTSQVPSLSRMCPSCTLSRYSFSTYYTHIDHISETRQYNTFFFFNWDETVWSSNFSQFLLCPLGPDLKSPSSFGLQRCQGRSPDPSVIQGSCKASKKTHEYNQ